MREVRPGDIILHLTDNSAFTGVSVAASVAEDFGGVPGSEWGGSGAHYRISLRDFQPLTPALPRQVFFSSPTKERLISLLDQGQRNVFYSREPSLNQGAYLTPATPELVAVLDEAYQRLAGKPMIDGLVVQPPKPSVLSNAVEQFAAALAESHVTFGVDVVRIFVASLATKPFAILTGLSGSGKTQLALQFGHWLGADRVEIIPVRPDWTGAEALFGYENALVPKIEGKAAWHVPPALKFMLRAAADPRNPYVLVLDEMNLAHVERYFADFLSGMESDEPCLPNLTESNGDWRPKATSQIAVPQNLFVIGTVNVDETTYMFSPKVLDRANTFEFRVATDSLQIDSRRPQPCPQGDPTLTQGFLSVARDDEWQRSNPAAEVDILVRHLRDLHRLLTRTGFEFGHRVFYEAMRFAAMLSAAGEPDPVVALDHQIMQKMLPRLHGSRRRLESTLCSVGHFCFDLVIEPPGSETNITFDPVDPAQGRPRLPLSFDKIQRMIRSLRQNQFASFIE
jgi:5-methylcytosine-specific restriction protein B